MEIATATVQNLRQRWWCEAPSHPIASHVESAFAWCSEDFSGPDDPKTIQNHPKLSKTNILLAQIHTVAKGSLHTCRDHWLRLAEGETSRRSGEDAFEAGRVKFRFPNLKRFHEFSSSG